MMNATISLSTISTFISCLYADNIRYGRPEATLDDCAAAAKTANALEFIEALPSGFNTAIGDQQIMLSGGQKQRIAIARAMLRQPRVSKNLFLLRF
jgi:ATP-binding cassette subfamily B protein